jgi:AsmA protein
MKKLGKWLAIGSCALIALIVVALLILPLFFDAKAYMPRIEQEVTRVTGRPFHMENIELSFFPWVGVSLSQVRMGNPKGFSKPDLVTVGKFDVKVKLVPLLFKEVEIKNIDLKGMHLVLEKRKDGQVNWEFPVSGTATSKAKSEASGSAPAPAGSSGIPLKALNVGQISISDSSIQWIDQTQGVQKTLSGISLMVKNISLDRPLKIDAFARLDQNPVSIMGELGPLGPVPGKGTIPLDIRISALKELELGIRGQVTDPMANMSYTFDVQTGEFSPKVVVASLGPSFAIVTADKNALQRVSFKAHLSGDARQVTVSDAVLKVDQSTLKFRVKLADFVKPDIAFSGHLDQIDLDRYLPPKETAKEGSAPPGPAPKASGAARGAGGAPASAKTDYKPLRALVVDGDFRVDTFKAAGVSGQNLAIRVKGENGIFSLNQLSLGLYKGAITAKGLWNCQKDIPFSKMELVMDHVQMGALLNDMLKKDLITGTAAASASLEMSGDTPALIEKSLNGSGHLSVKGGALKGIDLLSMVQNVAVAFGVANQPATSGAETAFTELDVPFTAKRGVLQTDRTILVSPVLQVMASGKANLPGDKLDFRVIPTLGGPGQKQGIASKYGQYLVPVLISGSLADPVFRPDVSGLVKKKVIDEALPKLFDSILKQKKLSNPATQQKGN